MSLLARLFYLFEFTLFYIKEVVISNLQVAYNVAKPNPKLNGAMIRVDVEGLTDRQLFIMANLITMTPGTLSLDVYVDNEKSELIVHSMFADNPDEVARDLERNYKTRISRVF